MKKVFIVAGELSGDFLARWYLDKQGYSSATCQLEGIGGDALAATGATLWARYEQLNVAGLWPVVCALPRIVTLFFRLVGHLRAHQIDELILVDFPGFNLRLAGVIKRLMPTTKIIYFSPPQLWCWGAKRVKKIQRFVDDVVVIYPFEVAWYAQHGVQARWLGLPLMDSLVQYEQRGQDGNKDLIGIFPASRSHEQHSLLPLFLRIVREVVRFNLCARILRDAVNTAPQDERNHKEICDENFNKKSEEPTNCARPEEAGGRLEGYVRSEKNMLTFVLFLPATLDRNFVEQLLQKEFSDLHDHIIIAVGEEGKRQYLSRCVAALAKPGTVSLELALLSIPSLIVYKTGWLTYEVAKRLVTIKFMALPNLLQGSMIVPEFIQESADVHVVAAQLAAIVEDYEKNAAAYTARQAPFGRLKKSLTILKELHD